MNIKHKICLIPRTAWGNNLRSYLTSSQWDKVRRKCYQENNYKCQICGGQGGNGRKHPVEAHEDWEFVNGEVRLVGIMSLCPPCHEFHHPGLAERNGKVERMLRQFMKVNGITRDQAISYMKGEFELWRQRSQQEWSLNIDYLSEYMGPDFKFKRPTAPEDEMGDAF
ncbi:putative HNH endonuclease [Salmonella phage SSBI34]|nr:putative HNH endonuclease [Salmonella phage SSBI34]